MNKIYKILTYTFVTLLLLLSLQTNAHSEEAYQYLLKEGDKIRVYSQGHTLKKFVGKFIDYKQDSLYMKSNSVNIRVIALPNIDSIQISIKKKGRSEELALKLAVVGALSTTMEISFRENSTTKATNKTQLYISRILLGALAGAWAGKGSSKWKDVPLKNLKLSFDFAPQYNNRLEISLSLSF